MSASPSVQAGDFVSATQKVIEISPHTTIGEAVATLAAHEITSAPVYDPTTQHYMGFFDVSDALALMFGIDMLKNLHPAHKLREQRINVHGISVDLSRSADLSGMDLPVSTMMQIAPEEEDGNVGHTAPWKPVYQDADLTAVVKLLAESAVAPWAPCRRVPVVNPITGRVEQIVSQSAIVRKIYETVVVKSGSGSASEPIFLQTPRTTGLGIQHKGHTPVLCVSDTDPLSKALAQLVDHRISAVPVLDSEGNVLDSITNKDMSVVLVRRMEASDAAQVYNTPVKEFLMWCNEAREAGSKYIRPPTVTVGLDTPMDKLIAELALNSVHRVFVLDDKKAVCGVISVSDVVKLMFNNNFPWPRALVVAHMGGKV